MPQFDLRGIRIGEYINTSDVITYDTTKTIGEAMNVNLELRFAEGRLYAESTLAEYIRKATGGTISIGVKYIPDEAAQLMYGATAKTRTIATGSTSKTIKGTVYSSRDVAKYVGVAFYAPDMVDGVEKYTCIFAKKALFGPPSYTLQTMGENITFATPTTSGEFLAANKADKELLEVAVCDSEADAIAWTYSVMGDTAPTV